MEDSSGQWDAGDRRNLSSEMMSPTFIVTDLLTSLGEKNQDPDYLVTKGNDLVTLLRGYSYIKDDLVIGAFGHRLQTLLTHNKKEVVATGYRISRYVISNQNSIKSLMSLRLDVLIIISLSKSSGYDVEREQALKLVRKMIDTPESHKELTRGIANAVLSIAEQVDDSLRKICIETCCEISLLRPDLIEPSNLIQFAVEAPVASGQSWHDMSELASLVISKLVNTPQGRSYFKTNDILKLISPITDFNQVDLHRLEVLDSSQKRLQHNSIDRLNSTCLIVANLLKSFSGFYLFSLNEFEPMKALMKCLRYPVNTIVSRILDVVLDILMIKPYIMKHSSNKTHLVPIKIENEPVTRRQYSSLLLAILLECGIADDIFYILNNSKDETNTTKAGFLLTELHNLSLNILPDDFHKINPSCEFNDDVVFFLEKLSRKSNSGRLNLGLQYYLVDSKLLSLTHLNNKDHLITKQVQPNALKIYGYIDEVKLKQIINDTKVLSSKNFTKWDCEIIEALFKGPFLNGRRLDEVNRTSKFIKRLLSFFRPFKNKFSSTKKTKNSTRFIKLGCVIFESLLKTGEGIKILHENKILPQIAECLAQLDPYSGFHAKDLIFSKERLSTTLTYGYFEMLGTLSGDGEGLKMLEKWKIFTMIHHISDNHFKREDIMLLFLNEMKFENSEHCRVILSKCLHSMNQTIKTRSTRLLAAIMKEGKSDKFALELVICQLYESVYDEDLRSIVLEILKDECDKSPEHLNNVVKLLPNVEILMKRFEKKKYSYLNGFGLQILLKFLSTEEGFRFLNKSGFIDDQFQLWINGGQYLTFVNEIEASLAPYRKSNQPLNLFEELVKTEEGFKMILKSGILSEFMNTIRHYSTLLNQGNMREVLSFDSLKLKACIWSVSFISVNSRGYESLDSNGCILDIINISRKTPLLDIKGTCFYVFSLISRTPDGYEVLDEMGLCTKLDVYNNSAGIVSPIDIYQFIRPYELQVQIKPTKDSLGLSFDFDESDRILGRIIKLVGGLCSHLNFDKYTNELFAISKKNPEYFSDPEVLYIILSFFENYKYRFTLRKFIIELFLGDRKMLETLVKRDKKRIKGMLISAKS